MQILGAILVTLGSLGLGAIIGMLIPTRPMRFETAKGVASTDPLEDEQ